MPEGFNELETSILIWFRDHYANQALSEQIESAKLANRKWTKVGFYIGLEVSNELPPIDIANFGGRWPINGPQLNSPDIEFGGGCILWGESGYIDCIEMYANGSFFHELVNEFVLLP